MSSRWVLGRAVEVGAITGAHGSVSSYLAGKSGLAPCSGGRSSLGSLGSGSLEQVNTRGLTLGCVSVCDLGRNPHVLNSLVPAGRVCCRWSSSGWSSPVAV